MAQKNIETQFRQYLLTTILTNTTSEKKNDLEKLDEKLKELLAQLNENEHFLSFKKYLNKKKDIYEKTKDTINYNDKRTPLFEFEDLLEHYSVGDIREYEFESKTIRTQFDILDEILYLMIADPIEEFLEPILPDTCENKWTYINYLTEAYLSQI